MKIVLCHRSFGWTATFFGVSGMPEDVEIPLPFTSIAPLAMVAADMRKRFGKTDYARLRLFYRDKLDHLSHVGV